MAGRIVGYLKKIWNRPAEKRARYAAEEERMKTELNVYETHRKELLDNPEKLLDEAEVAADIYAKKLEKKDKEFWARVGSEQAAEHAEVLRKDPEYDKRQIAFERKNFIARYVEDTECDRKRFYPDCELGSIVPLKQRYKGEYSEHQSRLGINTGWTNDYREINQKVNEIAKQRGYAMLPFQERFTDAEKMKQKHVASYKKVKFARTKHFHKPTKSATVAVILFIIGISTLAFLLTQIITNPTITAFFLFH